MANTENTIKFLKTYIETHESAWDAAVKYIDDRGWIDSFGIDALLQATAKQEFARGFRLIFEHYEDNDEEAIKAVIKATNSALVNTTMFNSSSFGENALSVFRVKEAQALADKLSWWRAVDEG